MIIESSLTTFGQYCIFMCRVFTPPQKWRVFGRKLLQEIGKLGLDSIPLTIVISIFIGAVICIQMQLNIVSPLVPSYSTGLATREIILLEFSNSILCLILAGKVGSNIASEIGTMRVTEQIDALDIMGINSANFLVLPKIVGF
uniref:MlaE family ABC transporter permease n=1 Tax=uncultured Muribaculum sp. TaxID=1918613 RepID=UPI0025B79FCB